MEVFEEKIKTSEENIENILSKLRRLSIARVIVFVGSLVLIVFLANERAIILLLIILPICSAIFILIVKRYNKLRFQEHQASFLKRINEEELLRLDNNLDNFLTGEEFITPGHAFTTDLDIFGKNSLFQLLNRTTTESGRLLLAKWLSKSVFVEEMTARREAVQELTPNVNWRQTFQAFGMHHATKDSDFFALNEWLGKEAKLLPKKLRYLGISIVLSVLACIAAFFYLKNLFTLGLNARDTLLVSIFLIPLLIVNGWFINSIRNVAIAIVDSLQQNVGILKAYEALIIKIEQEKFKSDKLQSLQAVFTKDGYVASLAMKELRRILSLAQLKATKKSPFGNQLYPLFNIFFIIDVYWIIASERWKEKYSKYVSHWIDAISEFEALNSMAGFHYANPSYTYPEISTAPYIIEFEALGHPLIHKNHRVENDFKIEGQGEITLITGSNMAGKSTFLRTVGLNLILAFMGAPCVAKGGRLSKLDVFTSMRTQDNLAAGVSSFYAELQRIELLLQLLKAGKPIFFMLDEMFKGTNSEDRFKGGVSLIKQLSELSAFGMISTHDLELSKIAGKHLNVSNFSFNSRIEAGQLLFDYKLTEGICSDFNASELMKRSGIEILSDYGG